MAPAADPARLRATRRFEDRPVSRSVLERICEVARWTGSARNRQPWRFTVVTDPEVAARLAQLGDYAGHLAGAPAVVVLLSDPGLGGADTEFDLGRLAQNVMLAAAGERLGSCVATLHPDERAAEAARLSGWAEPWLARHAISIGHPAPPPAGRSAIPTGRLPLNELVRWVEG